MTKKKLRIDKIGKLKLFGWYELVISGLVILLSLYSFYNLRFLPINFFLAIVGVMGGILLIKNINFGFHISLLWSGLQIVYIQVGDLLIDLSQLLSLNFPYFAITELQNYPGIAVGPNLVGIALLILLFVLGWGKR